PDLARLRAGADQVDLVVLVQPAGYDVAHTLADRQLPSMAEGTVAVAEEYLDLGLVEECHGEIGMAVAIEVPRRDAECPLTGVWNALHGVRLPAAHVLQDHQMVFPPVRHHEVAMAVTIEIDGDNVRRAV